MQQLRDDGGDTVEVAGAMLAFEYLGQPFDGDRRGDVTIGIHLVHRRCPHEIGETSELLLVPFEVTRVGVEVLVRSELGRVHEDAHDDGVGELTQASHVGQMALVERPHRRGESDRLAAPAHRRQTFTQLGDGRQSFHRSSSSSSSNRAVTSGSRAGRT